MKVCKHRFLAVSASRLGGVNSPLDMASEVISLFYTTFYTFSSVSVTLLPELGQHSAIPGSRQT